MQGGASNLVLFTLKTDYVIEQAHRMALALIRLALGTTKSVGKKVCQRDHSLKNSLPAKNKSRRRKIPHVSRR